MSTSEPSRGPIPAEIFASRQARRLRRSAESVAGLKRIVRPVTDERGKATFLLAYVRTAPDQAEGQDAHRGARTSRGAGYSRGAEVHRGAGDSRGAGVHRGAGDSRGTRASRGDTNRGDADAAPPILIIPGGPGLASAVPYAGLRRKAVKRGLDVLMVEHRGVGLSRRTATGDDLPLDAMRISLAVDDIRAVLDREGIHQVLVVGSSYGSYLATAFAATLPSRVAGLVLDSPLLGAGKAHARAWSTALLHDGTTGDETHRRLARKVRDTAADVPDKASRHQLARAVRIIYEFAGPHTLEAYLNQRAVGRARTTSALLEKLGSADTGTPVPYHMEFDRVAEIAFRELDYAETDPDVLFDSGAEFADLAQQYSSFSAEPVDTSAALEASDFPVIALSGDRDLRTPRPVATEAARLAPRGVLATVPDHGHSALDTHDQALFAAIDLALQYVRSAAREGASATHEKPAGPADVPEVRLEGLTRSGGPSAMLGGIIRAQLAADRLLPAQKR